MNIALIGNGGREHSLCYKLAESRVVKNIFCIPGNAGTGSIAENIKIDYLNFTDLLKTIKENNIDLVVVGPEEPLVNGIVDFLKKKKIKVFGPSKYASRLEGSKSFVKKLCVENNIPTADFKICTNKKQVLSFLENNKFPIVVKADGIAAGKGVSICHHYNEVVKISNEIFNGKFKSSKSLVLEEFLYGEEVSYFLIVDENSYSFFGTAQDHKRVGEKETGLNTGGMGAYSPSPIINKNLEKKILKRIIIPTINALKKRKRPYTGFLYAGLMIKNNEPFLIEYNVRMGDPECQVILPRIKNDLGILINACANNKLKNFKIKWSKEKSMTIVLCAKGYPGNYKKNIIIKNLKKVKTDSKSIIFHAGTNTYKDKIISQGGRVLNITSLGNSFHEIRKKIHQIIKKINWTYGFFRKDIGWRVINKR